MGDGWWVVGGGWWVMGDGWWVVCGLWSVVCGAWNFNVLLIPSTPFLGLCPPGTMSTTEIVVFRTVFERFSNPSGPPEIPPLRGGISGGPEGFEKRSKIVLKMSKTVVDIVLEGEGD